MLYVRCVEDDDDDAPSDSYVTFGCHAYLDTYLTASNVRVILYQLSKEAGEDGHKLSLNSA